MSHHIEGTSDALFTPLRDLLEHNIEDGKEEGVSIAVEVEGKLIADLWGGFADSERARPWVRDTISPVWSSTKMITNLAVLVLVDRGLVDVDAPVHRYWPEFAANGKDGVLVRHLMSHTSGVSGWDSPFEVSDLFDLETSTARLAAQAPWWEPGSASGYHANTQGHLLGEIVRRVSGSSLTEFVRTQIAAPLDADFQIGLRHEDYERTAEMVPPPPYSIDFAAALEADPNNIMIKSLGTPMLDPRESNSTAWRQAEVGAINGHGNARSLATILSTISSNGISEGTRLLGRDTVDLIFREQSNGVDLVLGLPVRWGMGYALASTGTVPYIPEGDTCFWGGLGGSMTVMDRSRRTTISYTMNKMATGVIGSDRSAEYVGLIYDSLG